METPPTYERLFPKIEDILIEVKEEGHMVQPNRRKSYELNKHHVRSTFPCHNTSCKTNRGINILPLITDMVRNKKPTENAYLVCDGWETSMHRNCWTGFNIKISIKYKEPR